MKIYKNLHWLYPLLLFLNSIDVQSEYIFEIPGIAK